MTAYQPVQAFGFAGEDQTGRFAHRFTLQPDDRGMHVERQVSFRLTIRQWLLFLVLRYPVRLPAAKQALDLLKRRLEQRGTEPAA